MTVLYFVTDEIPFLFCPMKQNKAITNKKIESFFTLSTFMSDSVVILKGEVRCS